MTLEFLGKWTFGQGGSLVRIDMTSGLLSVGSATTGQGGAFNAYGSKDAFVLQGDNGKYVVSSGDGYAATAARSGTLNYFTLVDGGDDNCRVKDLGPGGTAGTALYWNNASGALKAVAVTSSPPATTLFVQTEVTVGLASLLEGGFGQPTPDVTWVNYSGVDFTEATGVLDFTQLTMPYVDFSDAVFPGNLGFDGSTGPNASFRNATLSDCSLARCVLTNADFTNARLDDTSLEGSDFTGATLNGANLNGCMNLQDSIFRNAHIRNADFRDIGNIVDTDFTGADLSGTRFTGASVTGAMILNGANLTGVALNNPGEYPTIYPGFIKLDKDTNCTDADLTGLVFDKYDLSGVNFTRANLTRCSFKAATMRNTELSYAQLNQAVMTGTVLLNGANLSNASLRDADLTNAQMGALAGLFSVGASDPDYTIFLDGLNNKDTAKVQKVFADYGYSLTGTITITQSTFSSTTWTVQASGSTPSTYTVVQDTIAGQQTLGVYLPTTPALLSNAFMVNVNFTNANMIGVNASGCAAYSIGGKAPTLNSALLQRAQFNNANLGSVDFSSANLAGVSFDYATLTNARFGNSKLVTDAGGSRATFNGTNLQGVDFDGATISAVSFNNAAFGVSFPQASQVPAGVWLFSLTSDQAALITPELTAAALPNPPTGPQHQFGLIPQALQQLQTPGPVGRGIVTQFQSHGVTLTDAILTICGSSVYWQLTDGATRYVIFQAIDGANYTPALGVATGSEYTLQAQFYLPLSLQGSLNNGLVDPAVRAAFAAAGHPVSANAIIAGAQHPTEWQIINGAPGHEVYSLWLDVTVPSAPVTVRLAIPNVITAFNNVSLPLSNRSTVITSKYAGWSLNNDAENPFVAITGYIMFNLIPDSKTGGLNVYGSIMRVRRLSGPATYEYANIPAAITSLTETQMSAAGNVCPNGDFATSNIANNLPYENWLRARVAPRPPLCIPDPAGMFYCPL